MRSTAQLGLAALLLLFAVSPMAAQGQAQESADLKAYRPIHDEKTPFDKKAALAEAFFAESAPAFVESPYRNDVYLIQLGAYLQLANWPKVIDTLDRLETLAPKTPPAQKLKYYENGMRVANELKDGKRVMGYAEKVVGLDPTHVLALLALATIPDGAQESEVKKAVDYGKRLLNLPKPEGAADAQWQDVRKAIEIQNQTIEALAIFEKKDYVGCVKAYEDLIKLSPKDPDAHYRMGICIFYQVRSANELAVAANKAHIAFVEECNKELVCDSEENKAKIAELKAKDEQMAKNYDEVRGRAIDAFAKAVAIGGAGQEVAAARTELERLYKSKARAGSENPLEGLDTLIAQKKKEIGE